MIKLPKKNKITPSIIKLVLNYKFIKCKNYPAQNIPGSFYANFHYTNSFLNTKLNFKSYLTQTFIYPIRIFFIFIRRFIHVHLTSSGGKILTHMPANYMYKFLKNYNKDSLYFNSQKKTLKKYKKKINFYIQIIRILKSMVYNITNKLIIIQCGNHKYMRRLLTIFLKKATPIHELLEVIDDKLKIEEKFKQEYYLPNIWQYILRGNKSYGVIKTKKRNSIKKKLYKRIYTINPRFV